MSQGFSMDDVKIVSVVVGSSGRLACAFDHQTGELKIWPNAEADNAPEDATLYELASEATTWSMFDKEE